MKRMIATLLSLALAQTGQETLSRPEAVSAADEKRVRVVKDVAYLGADRSEKLDLYLPVTDTGPARPAMVIIHGGGWYRGDKAANREQNIGQNLAAAGYVCASINYRLAKDSRDTVSRLRDVWPGALDDCKTAVRFLRRHAGRYNIDAEHIGAIGGSAGGHLAALLAVTDAEDGLDPDELYAEFSCRIQAVVPMYGVHDVLQHARLRGCRIDEDVKKLCREASPLTYVTAGDPPALILHGTMDALVPIDQSLILQSHLQAAGVRTRVFVIQGAPHSFHLQPKERDLRPVVVEFFDRHLK
jgi:acetyl esterase/lipase